MFTKEDLESWNELFPDCKMSEADLSNPSEPFLTKTLINYLRMFGYKVEPPAQLTAGDSAREKRLFLIKLVRHIDHILKITDKSYTFTYYDLLRPTPKKTSHMLGILLNYLYYYNMYKTDVFTMANERLKMRQELLEQIKRTQEDNEQRKIRAEKMKEEIAALSTQIPKEKSELENLNVRHQHIQEQLKQLQKIVGDLNIAADELQVQKRSLKRQIVPENEGQELEMQFTKLQENIAEREKFKCALENNLQEHSMNVNHLQDLLKGIEEAKEVVPSRFVENYKESKKKLVETTALLGGVEHDKQNKLLIVERQEQTLKSFAEKLQLEETQNEQETSKKSQAIASKEDMCNSYTKQLEALKNDDHVLECQLEEQKDIRAYVEQGIAALMSGYAAK